MPRNTVIGVFDSYAHAERALNDLAAAGFSRDRVNVSANEAATATTAEATRDESFGERIAHFFRSLFGAHDDRADAAYYSEAVRRGSTVVCVHAATEDEADKAADVLNASGAIDIQERAKGWRESGRAGTTTEGLSGSAPAEFRGGEGEKVIPVVSEELQVGKRRRERGGVRIYTHMDESPVDEQVRLREERVRVERRPADRPATEADVAAFKEGTIEVRETVEEPVVAKRARVVEEVVVDKETTERTEKVNDVVRHAEVDVEQLGPGGAPRAASGTKTYDEYDADYRSHWQTSYGTAGGAYEQYLPAYRYGSMLGEDERYRNRSWNDIEADARRDWETRYPGGAWDKFKAAVRYGWERVTGKR
ncbi:MAG: YsnF/AvaK domain-containing protein [Rhodospirillaceae bacterium]